MHLVYGYRPTLAVTRVTPRRVYTLISMLARPQGGSERYSQLSSRNEPSSILVPWLLLSVLCCTCCAVQLPKAREEPTHKDLCLPTAQTATVSPNQTNRPSPNQTKLSPSSMHPNGRTATSLSIRASPKITTTFPHHETSKRKPAVLAKKSHEPTRRFLS